MTPAEIIAALEGLNALLGLIERSIAAGRERGEWTDVQEAAFDEKLKELKRRDYWTPKGN